MSEGNRLPLEWAEQIASQIMALILSSCRRVALAGSIRRRKPDVGDIEIVCIPADQPDLFGTVTWPPEPIEKLLTEAGYTLLKNGPHLKQFEVRPFNGFNCELYITTPAQWGVIYTIRTGSAEFSHRLVTPKSQGGWLPSFLRVENGRIWHGDVALDTPDEEDVFRAIGMNWIEPERRL